MNKTTALTISLIIAIVLFFVGIIAFLFYQNYQLRQQIIGLQALSLPTPTSVPTSTPKSTLVPAPAAISVKSSPYYYLEMRLKSAGNEPHMGGYSYLGPYFQKVLNFATDKKADDVIPYIAYDVRDGMPHAENTSRYNFNYYIALSVGEIEPKIYEDEYTTIKVSRIDPDIGPYIENADFCKMDSDCTIRSNFCQYGSFNYYHPFADMWGCGLPSDESGYIFGDHDVNMGCTTDVTYESSKCIDNQCIGQNRKVFCEGQ
jgi:hypothetical protein